MNETTLIKPARAYKESYFYFELLHQSTKSRARVGRIHTPHGIIDTPNFVAVGTNGALKAVDSLLANTVDLQLMFCNTYHLMLQPGADIIEQAGGLHTFINRNKPIITDSGGFQVFSLANGVVNDELKSRGTKNQQGSVLKTTEEGVTFRSYRNGDRVVLTPESSVLAQKKLGADIIIPFDELPPYHIDPRKLEQSLHRTHRWEKRSLETHLADPREQAMYAVVHGGVDQRLRALSCQTLSSMPFDGYAVGGSLGKNHQEMFDLLDFVMPRLPHDKPNHLLGIGDLKSVEACIKAGVDTMDSSHPTRCARHGLLFTKRGTVKAELGVHRTSFRPIEEDCPCMTCQNYTVAYLHHLFKAHEPIAHTLASIHNIQFMVSLMHSYRVMILNGDI